MMSSSLPGAALMILLLSPLQSAAFLPAVAPPRLPLASCRSAPVSRASLRKACMCAPAVPKGGSGPGERPIWQLSQEELTECLNRNEWMVDQNEIKPSELTEEERAFLPSDLLDKRVALAKRSVDANAALLNEVKKYVAAYEGKQDVMRVVAHEDAMGRDYYVSLSAVLLHLLRDWGPECKHVLEEAYIPMVQELKRHKPVPENGKAPSVFVPGSGLSRLPYEFMMAGYDVECNENSKIFVTISDYLFNHMGRKQPIAPMSHIFTEHHKLADQFFESNVPSTLPLEGKRDGRTFTMTHGDMVDIYKKGGSGHRKFDCVVTCFFIDTCDDLIDYCRTIDELLDEGGVWINFGPLNYQPKLKLKLVWEEMRALWEHMGYVFVQDKRVQHCYNLREGIRLHTERYDVVFSTAIKRKAR